jgi:polysaccharide pyruvyl transferase WcaK-like protein
MAEKQVHRISIMTAVGCGNLGDEYILRSEYVYLRKHFPDARITIFTYSREAMLEYDF